MLSSAKGGFGARESIPSLAGLRSLKLSSLILMRNGIYQTQPKGIQTVINSCPFLFVR